MTRNLWAVLFVVVTQVACAAAFLPSVVADVSHEWGIK